MDKRYTPISVMLKKHISIFVFLLLSSGSLICQTLSGDIETYINTFISGLPGSNKNDFVAPSSDELMIWEELMSHLIKDELSEARQQAEMVNYRIVDFEDLSLVDTSYYYVVEEKSERNRYWGTYIVNRYPLRRGLVIQSPHPRYDSNTGSQGIFCFKRLGAGFFFISGTHRCNHTTYSTCSGTTTACGVSAPYRISDNPHNLISVFQKTTEVLYKEIDNTVFIQLHGFAKKETDPYVIMSNGSRVTPDPDYIPVLRDELYKIDNSLTFKIPHIDLSWTRLIAFTNVQGRFINNSPSPCSQNAVSSTGRFIHIEQEKSKLRENFIGWLKMYEALANTFPETPVSTGNLKRKAFHADIYPNPSEGIINIQATGPYRISVFSVSGQSIYNSDPLRDRSEIDLSSHPSGIYLLRVTSGQGTVSRKIIIK